jgi:hypothetical protein
MILFLAKDPASFPQFYKAYSALVTTDIIQHKAPAANSETQGQTAGGPEGTVLSGPPKYSAIPPGVFLVDHRYFFCYDLPVKNSEKLTRRAISQ